MHMYNNKTWTMNRQSGISLIEIMIALLIGLLVTFGAIQLFISNKNTYRVETALSRLQETGRYIVDTMAREIRMAGFNGCSSRGNITPNIIANDPPPYDGSNERAVLGYEATGTNAWTPTILAYLSNVRDGTDVVNIQRGDDCGAQVTGNFEPDNANVQVSFPNNCGFYQQQPVLITDCVGADIYQISNNPKNDVTGGNKQTTAHGNNTNNTVNLSKTYGPDSSIFGFRSYAFYIAPSAIDANEPAMWMANWVPNTDGVTTVADYQFLELGSGVEDMQILYGVDTAAPDEYADTYVTADTVDAGNNWTNVRSVRVNLLLRSEDGVTEDPRAITFNGAVTNTGAGADNRLRMVYTATITLRNRLP